VIRSRCEVLSVRRTGAFASVTLVAPEISERSRPGQFIQVGAPPGRERFLRRPFFVHETSRRGGWAGTIEFVLDPAGPGLEWLAEVKAHHFLDVIGPLGKPFSLPGQQVNCLLVAEELGASPLFFLAEELQARGLRVDMIVGAGGQDRLFKSVEAKRLSRTITVVTEDGSAGDVGRPADALADVASRCGSQVVYAAGPRDLLRSVGGYCRARRIPAQVAVEERMACGLGLCWTCVVPVARKDGSGYDNVRSCVDGPAVNAARILWDRWDGASTMAPTPPEGFPAVRGWPG
jgi:dihydroorotate dehydrogenase electron transfer subunit